MNRRYFLYASTLATAASRLPAFGQAPAPIPYGGSPEVIDAWMTAANADLKKNLSKPLLASVNRLPASDFDSSRADFVILTDKPTVNGEKPSQDAIAVQHTEAGVQVSKVKPPKPSDRTMSVYGVPGTVRFAGKGSGMYYTTAIMGLNDIRVPDYFVTDLASIPAILWAKLPPNGPYMLPAIVHDWLYWNQGTTKAYADDVLKRGMITFGVSTFDVGLIYDGVHVGGQSAWDNNAKLKASGEKRVLASVPTDALVTWDTWKADPAHFA